MLGWRKPWSVSQTQGERDCWYVCSNRELRTHHSVSGDPSVPNSRVVLGRLNLRPASETSVSEMLAALVCSHVLLLFRLRSWRSFYPWGSWGPERMKSMGKVKSSVWVPPWAGCPSKEHFTVFPFFVRLIYFKFYFGHLSVDNGNNPNENKCR